MLQFRSLTHQRYGVREIGARIFRCYEIGDLAGDFAVVLGRQQALRTQEIVVKKLRVRIREADVAEETKKLVIVERSPGWQRDLKMAKAQVEGNVEALANGSGGK